MIVEDTSYPPMYPGPYPKAMESPYNKELFDGIHETRVKLARAIDRCKDVGLTEAVMGYHKSAQEYSDLVAELIDAKPWIEKHMQSLVKLANIGG